MSSVASPQQGIDTVGDRFRQGQLVFEIVQERQLGRIGGKLNVVYLFRRI